MKYTTHVPLILFMGVCRYLTFWMNGAICEDDLGLEVNMPDKVKICLRSGK